MMSDHEGVSDPPTRSCERLRLGWQDLIPSSLSWYVLDYNADDLYVLTKANLNGCLQSGRSVGNQPLIERASTRRG